ncbi:hypothetical protein [Paracoccus lutimaris]|uniref:T4 beta protein n=1 Tax=Paracoccus lutimaris TaxID=1490030 RepID=A0A368YCC1_9RHOB|nr:T4 beta protein [Paracoccus lutimaris]
MADKYHLVLRTGQSEMRAYQNLTLEQKVGIAPLIELTRGRKNHKSTFEKTSEQYNFGGIKRFVASETLGSRLIDLHSQNMTVAARATADRKVLADLS